MASSFRGVRWHERNSKWEARIFNGERQVSLGYFEAEVPAAMAFDAAAIQLRGPTTCTNFVSHSANGDRAGKLPMLTPSRQTALGKGCLQPLI